MQIDLYFAFSKTCVILKKVSLETTMALTTSHRFATRQQRRILMILQDFKCALCGEELSETFDCDHIVPASQGGATTISNLQGVCKQCHIDKTNLDGSRKRTT